MVQHYAAVLVWLRDWLTDVESALKAHIITQGQAAQLMARLRAEKAPFDAAVRPP
jgi:hypothetical protein